MSHKRVIRIISYEGNDYWVDRTVETSALRLKRLRTIFTGQGTIREINSIELKDGEELETIVKGST